MSCRYREGRLVVNGSLAGKRVLVAEDEFLIAHDLKRALTALDAEVIGPVSNLPAGLSLLDGEELDAAVLDVNLCGSMSFPLADRLNEAGVPILFVTGYDEWALPDQYLGAPRIAKPFNCGDVTSAVERMCQAGAAR